MEMGMCVEEERGVVVVVVIEEGKRRCERSGERGGKRTMKVYKGEAQRKKRLFSLARKYPLVC